MAHVSKSKARKILREGTARGRRLTSRQKKFFGFLSGGGRHRKRK